MLTDNFVTMEIGKAKHIALVDHHGKKKELIEWCDRNKEVLQGHFLCGTGTTARLIAEKTGPHFAVGDTCYSWSEEIRVYNPNGKEIVAKDNSCSLLTRVFLALISLRVPSIVQSLKYPFLSVRE